MQEAQGRTGMLAVGNGGWVCYRASDLAEPVFARLVEADDGRLEVADLFIGFAAPPSARSFRGLSEHLSLLTAIANGEEAEAVKARMGLPGPDLRTAARYFATGLGREPESGWPWPERMLLAQTDADEPKPLLPRLPPQPAPAGAIALDVSIPTTRPYPDEFYAEVADAYESAATRSSRPAAAIAEANGVPVKTVHGWVSEARRRRHLPPGRKGRYA